MFSCHKENAYVYLIGEFDKEILIRQKIQRREMLVNKNSAKTSALQ